MHRFAYHITQTEVAREMVADIIANPLSETSPKNPLWAIVLSE